MKRALDYELRDAKDLTIIAGGASGADTLAIRYAKENNINYCIERAEWNKDNEYRTQGYDRNERMADLSDRGICFWDGKSKGTKHMIKYMRTIGKEVSVYKYDERQLSLFM